VFVIDVANALLTFAQVAIGLAGFSAILVALSGKPDQWTPVDAFRIRNILAFTFQSVFLSLMPFVLAFLSLPESNVWQVSLLILAIATLGSVLLVAQRCLSTVAFGTRCLERRGGVHSRSHTVLHGCRRTTCSIRYRPPSIRCVFPWSCRSLGSFDRIGRTVPICPARRLTIRSLMIATTSAAFFLHLEHRIRGA
jgi:hypothetical protein